MIVQKHCSLIISISFFQLLYRARYLALVVVGESHPEVALIDSNIGLILHAVGEYEPSLKFLEKALELNIRFHGSKSLKVAVSYHLVARTQSCMGDFRSALQNERETFAIYKSQLGDEHDKTKVKFMLDNKFCARAKKSSNPVIFAK
jgi:protein TIF31